VTNQVAARRVRQMGEDPASVYVVGSTGLDTLRRMELVEHATLAQEFGCRFCAPDLLVTFYPVRLEPDATEHQFQALLSRGEPARRPP